MCVNHLNFFLRTGEYTGDHTGIRSTIFQEHIGVLILEQYFTICTLKAFNH